MWDGVNWLIWIVGPLIGMIGMFAGGYWGVGCGWLVVPSMLILGLTPMEAVGVALLQMVPATLPTVIRTAHEISWKKQGLGCSIILPLGAGSFLASFTGQPVNQFLYRHFGASALMLLFAGVMIVIGLQTALSRAVENPPADRIYSGRESIFALIGGLCTGVFSSVLGVGGAVLMRPILASGFKVSERETSVSIRILLLVTTLTGGATYLFGPSGFQPRILILALLIAAGGMVGFPFGVKLHNLVAGNGYTQHIHKSFAVIAFIVITSTFLKLAGYTMFSRYLMLGFAAILLTYLLAFGRYTMKHPRTGETRP